MPILCVVPSCQSSPVIPDLAEMKEVLFLTSFNKKRTRFLSFCSFKFASQIDEVIILFAPTLKKHPKSLYPEGRVRIDNLLSYDLNGYCAYRFTMNAPMDHLTICLYYEYGFSSPSAEKNDETTYEVHLDTFRIDEPLSKIPEIDSQVECYYKNSAKLVTSGYEQFLVFLCDNAYYDNADYPAQKKKKSWQKGVKLETIAKVFKELSVEEATDRKISKLLSDDTRGIKFKPKIDEEKITPAEDNRCNKIRLKLKRLISDRFIAVAGMVLAIAGIVISIFFAVFPPSKYIEPDRSNGSKAQSTLFSSGDN